MGLVVWIKRTDWLIVEKYGKRALSFLRNLSFLMCYFYTTHVHKASARYSKSHIVIVQQTVGSVWTLQGMMNSTDYFLIL